MAARLGMESYSRSFSCPPYASLRAALLAAEVHRDEMERALGLLVRDWEDNAGINRVQRDMPDRNRPLCGWRATWREGPATKRVTREKFFGFLYGDPVSEARAKKQAKRYRAQMILKHHAAECYRTKREW